MSAPYNYSLIENSTGLLPLFQQVNEWTAGAMSILFLAIIALVMFAATRNQDSKTGFLVISFITTLSASMLFLLELVKMSVVGVCIALFIGAFMYYFLSD